MIASPSSTLRESQVVLVLTILGAALRFWSFGRLGLTHFDEGIYAISGFWSVVPGGLSALDPMVIPYSPPGFPILVGIGYFVFGVADVSAIFASAVVGVATIPVTAWLARRTFGPGAGAAAAALASVSLMHVAFSRKALTDVPFLFAWLAAIGLGGRFLEAPRLGRALALGLAVGLAQNFKYNGWLAGAIVATSAALGPLVLEGERRRGALLRTWGFGLLAALTALLIDLPWIRFVEDHGGYAALLRHHRGYLGGAWSWIPHLDQQLAQVVALSGGPAWGAGSWCLAWLGAAVATSGPALLALRTRWGWSRFRLGLGGGMVTLAAVSNLSWWAGLALLPRLLGSSRPAERMLGTWWVVLTILTPVYHPYARLWLPLGAAGWIVLGGWIVRLGPFAIEPKPPADRDVWVPSIPRHRLAAIVGCVALGFIQQSASGPRAIRPREVFEPTDTLRSAIADVSHPRQTWPRALHVLARRPAVFYLLTSGRPFGLYPGVGPLLEASRPGDSALVDDALLLQEGDLVEVRGRFRDWIRWGEWQERLDPVTLLDIRPEAAFGRSPDAHVSLQLLVRSGGALIDR